MTSEEAVQFEARRVAAAFGVEEWEIYRNCKRVFIGLDECDQTILWHLDQKGELECLLIEGDVVLEEGDSRQLEVHYTADYGDLMARGLYCLGFEDEAVLSQLPELSMHEKLHLRQTMPRKFWPPQWEKEVATVCPT